MEDRVDQKVYLPADIMKILGISKTTCYAFLNKVYKDNGHPFKVIKINSSLRIPKEGFDSWLSSEE